MKTSIEYIKEAWGIYTKKENFIYFAKIMAVITIFSFSVSLLNNYLIPDNYLKQGDFSKIPLLATYVALSVASIVIGLWSQSTHYLAILNMNSDERKVLNLGFKKIIKLFVISFVVGLIVVLGAVMLIVPAIMFGIWYSFSVWLVLDKNMGIREALKTSKQMTKGKFWKILGRSVIFGLFTFIVSILISIVPYFGTIVLMFVAPLFLLPYYLMYKDLLPNS